MAQEMVLKALFNLLSQSVAKTFGNDDPVGKTITFRNKYDPESNQVYEDFPYNSSFNKIKVFTIGSVYYNEPMDKKMDDPWGSNFTQC
jgi:hypothetical protein